METKSELFENVCIFTLSLLLSEVELMETSRIENTHDLFPVFRLSLLLSEVELMETLFIGQHPQADNKSRSLLLSEVELMETLLGSLYC